MSAVPAIHDPRLLRKPVEVWSGQTRIAAARFGSDHWGMLLRLAEPDRVWRHHWTDGATFLTDVELHGHTDIDVLDDLEAEHLIHQFEGECRLSAEGSVMRAELVTHLAAGGNYANFTATVTTREFAA